MSILTPNTTYGDIRWADPEDTGAATISYNHADNHMQFTVNGQNNSAIYVNKDSYVGLSTSSPVSRFHLYSPLDNGGVYQQTFHIGDGTYGLFAGSDTSQGYSPALIGFSKNTTAWGLGLTGQCDSSEDTGTTPLVNISGTRRGGTNISTRPVFGVSNYVTRLMTVLANGNVGIGTSTPSSKLQVNGTATALRLCYSIFTLITSSKLQVNGTATATSFTTTSDSRLKHNIEPIRGALVGVQCLEGVTFQWNDPEASADRQIGLIAQQVERCFPEAVRTDDQGYKSVAYGQLVAPLIEAVKEQQGVMTGMKGEIAALKAREKLANEKLVATNERLSRLEAAIAKQR